MQNFFLSNYSNIETDLIQSQNHFLITPSSIDSQIFQMFSSEYPNTLDLSTPSLDPGSKSTSIPLSSTYSPNPFPTSFPLDMKRNQWPVLAVYAVLMLVGGVGNLAVLAALARGRRRRSRVALLMTHLAIADVCVTCGVIPLEIGWKYTNAWVAGNVACKAAVVVRAFGLYLSSNVLVCISLDRLFAVLYPLRTLSARRRNRRMLWTAWIAAGACSLPQSVVFRVMRHPRVEGFEQCVSFSAFTSPQQEVAYNVFCVCAMYVAPLAVIAACYAAILHAVQRSATLDGVGDSAASSDPSARGPHSTRPALASVRPTLAPVRPTLAPVRPPLARARRRTLRMTVTIVAVFALCWLPYATMALWYMIDRASASRVAPQVQDLLFAMAVSNSCMNPLVYGSYALDLRGFLRRLWGNTCCGGLDHGEPNVENTNNNHNNVAMETRVDRPLNKSHHVRFAETTAGMSGRPTVAASGGGQPRGSA